MKDKISIGIMQGRLSPPVDGKIQFFPWKTWKDEFKKAAAVSLDEIEFIFDADDYVVNPVYHNDGVEEIKKLIADTGVKVNFICADYFMHHPLFGVSKINKEHSKKVLEHLIYQAGKLKAKGVEIPLVDQSSLKNDTNNIDEFRESLQDCLDFAQRSNICIGLETDLAPKKFKELLSSFAHPLIKANYDVGNSASLGYGVEEEFASYGQYVNNIHIKDRVRGGGTVPLGTGNADFSKFAKAVTSSGYNGGFILQAAREGDEVSTAKKNMLFVQRLFNGGK